ncbi:DUF4352 domain-containing protein [Peribacillus sp. SI8-4]|uniref:DUF4352 domain-containing protein n=1 Tax=Peribacillus sp. SI8-4 TaxID=3048009 RepID=UPI002552E9D3|nr:DUF4352 domain-containing protein [Peribacillus sp. SI8-4]
MKALKINLSIVLLIAALILSACGMEKNVEKSDINKTIRSNKVDMIVTNLVVSNSQSEKKDMIMLEVEMEFKNKSKSDYGVGAHDFKVKDQDGKVHEAYGMEPDNFGDVLSPGKSMKGTGYYEIPKNTKNVTFIYQPKKDSLAEWKLTVPERKR